MRLQPDNEVPNCGKLEDRYDIVDAARSTKFDDGFRRRCGQVTAGVDEVVVPYPLVVRYLAAAGLFGDEVNVPIELVPTTGIDAPESRSWLLVRARHGKIGAQQISVLVVPQLTWMRRIRCPLLVGITDCARVIDVGISYVPGLLRIARMWKACRKIALSRGYKLCFARRYRAGIRRAIVRARGAGAHAKGRQYGGGQPRESEPRTRNGRQDFTS
jgi:hypothetical protein